MAQTFKNLQKSNLESENPNLEFFSKSSLDFWTSLDPWLRAIKAGGMKSNQNTHWNHIRYGTDSEESIRCAEFPSFQANLVAEVPKAYLAWFYSASRKKDITIQVDLSCRHFKGRKMAKNKTLSVQPETWSSIGNHLQRQSENHHPPQTAASLWCPYSKKPPSPEPHIDKSTFEMLYRVILRFKFPALPADQAVDWNLAERSHRSQLMDLSCALENLPEGVIFQRLYIWLVDCA